MGQVQGAGSVTMEEEKKYKVTVELTPKQMGGLIRYADKSKRTYTEIMSALIAETDFKSKEVD
ncbi:hypothetical protein [Vibrio mediterranei]|uniref:hypothetical protein n=1 Tax=Vibrio mediterranei TaxID=689 RepID=UPI00148DF6AD|nr:hypothetical protein [Vibrio mediterranei]NOH27866.1 hypothetical protein [Vibrio mediterranei]